MPVVRFKTLPDLIQRCFAASIINKLQGSPHQIPHMCCLTFIHDVFAPRPSIRMKCTVWVQKRSVETGAVEVILMWNLKRCQAVVG